MVKTSINKDEVNELPLGKYEGRIIIVDTPLQVADAIEEIENENIIGRIKTDFYDQTSSINVQHFSSFTRVAKGFTAFRSLSKSSDSK